MWAAQQFHWEWPIWAVVLVACVSAVFLIWTVISGARWLWHLLNDWRANHGYSRLHLDASYIIVALLSGAAVLLVAAAIVFFAHSATATTGGAAAVKTSGRPDTRLRLRLDPAGTRNYLQESETNIANWQQTIVAMSSHDTANNTMPIIHADTFSLVFTQPIDYERPIIESFGHKLGGFNFYSLGTRGAVFQFYDAVQAPMIELWFPPPGYYAQQSSIKVSPPGEKPPDQQPSQPIQQKEPSPRTAPELFALHEGRSGLEADRLLDPFKNLWIPPIEGVIKVSVPDGGGGAMLVVGLENDNSLECHFAPARLKEVSRYKEGDRISVAGQVLRYTGAHLIVLWACEIAK